MASSAIHVEGLSKAYRIGVAEAAPDTLTAAVTGLLTEPFRRFRRLRRLDTSSSTREDSDAFWALRDVSFTVPEGDVLGVIGRNGAGKSTLLKVLSRITEPTAGRAWIRGRVSSLLEVGTGFHPELTGRENVYLNGTILGMSKREIDAKFAEIVDFAGVEKFLDTAIKHYSSGMKVRLAFAVAAHLEPEILIIDEVLAVGDAEFQRKCLGKMHNVARSGRTVLFVSHNMVAVRELCTSAIVLQNGSIVNQGTPDACIDAYMASAGSVLPQAYRAPKPQAGSPIHVESIELELAGKQPSLELRLAMRLRSVEQHERAFLAIDIFDPSGSWVMQGIPEIQPFLECDRRSRELRATVDLPGLIPGHYSAGVWIGSHFSRTLVEVREAVGFEVVNSPTPGRTKAHSPARGYVVPRSHVTHLGRSE